MKKINIRIVEKSLFNGDGEIRNKKLLYLEVSQSNCKELGRIYYIKEKEENI